MLAQLILIGYCLTFIFNIQSAWSTAFILSGMAFCACWIALNVIEVQRRALFQPALIAMLIGGLSTLFLCTFGTLELRPWYKLEVVIPLAGMVFANVMNGISLCTERLYNEIQYHAFEVARNKAFNAAMIPLINTLFSVGLVSLPGMMTGQILSGVSPLIAVRYQIMVMCMIFGATGISCGIYLMLIKSTVDKKSS